MTGGTAHRLTTQVTLEVDHAPWPSFDQMKIGGKDLPGCPPPRRNGEEPPKPNLRLK